MMSTQQIAVVGALVLVVLISARPVLAQDSAQSSSIAAEREAEGRRRFVEGREAYERGDYELAHRAFQASYQITVRPELLYNVGLAAQKLGRVGEAIDAFENYVQWGKGDREEEVRGRLAALRDLEHRGSDQSGPGAAPSAPAPVVMTETVPAPAAVVAPQPTDRPTRADDGSKGRRRWLIASAVILAVAGVAVGIAVPLARRGDEESIKKLDPSTGLVIHALRWGGQ